MDTYFPKELIDQYYPGALMIPPMLAWKLPANKKDMKNEIATNGEYFAEEKMNGYSYTAEITPQGSYLFSRGESKKTGLLVEKSANVPHIMEELDWIFGGDGRGITIVVGEIYFPGGTAKDVTTIMQCLPDKAVKRQETNKLRFYIHDILFSFGENLMQKTNWERIQILNFNFLVQSRRFQYLDIAQPVLENIPDFIETSLKDPTKEGVILKLKKGLYYPTKRPAWNFVKFKIEETHDVIAMKFLPPKKFYEGTEIESWKYWEGDTAVTKPYKNGWIGSIEFGVYKDGKLVPIGSVASGLTDSLLEKIKENPDEYLGFPMEVKAMFHTESALIHPVFLHFRDDIPVKNCTWEKIFD